MTRILNPQRINEMRYYAESTEQDELAVVIVQGRQHLANQKREEWEHDHIYMRNAPHGSAGRPSPLGSVVLASELDTGVAPAPGYYWIDVDGTMVDKTEEFGKPDPAIDGWAGIWHF